MFFHTPIMFFRAFSRFASPQGTKDTSFILTTEINGWKKDACTQNKLSTLHTSENGGWRTEHSTSSGWTPASGLFCEQFQGWWLSPASATHKAHRRCWCVDLRWSLCRLLCLPKRTSSPRLSSKRSRTHLLGFSRRSATSSKLKKRWMRANPMCVSRKLPQQESF